MIEFSDVSKMYKTDSGIVRALDGVSFRVARGERVGVIGHNGSGKSTLVRLAGGVEKPTRGKVTRTMSISWPLGFRGGVHKNLTGEENTRFLAAIYNRPKREVLEVVADFSELGARLKDPVKTYSAGMRAKLSFGLSLAFEFDCYLIDEVIALGDRRFRRKCLQEMFEKRGDRAMLIVSHMPAIIRQYCGTAMILSNGRFVDRVDVTDRAAWRRYADPAPAR
jgi:capsular polysaccharide transport system ATP-binding protein